MRWTRLFWGSLVATTVLSIIAGCVGEDIQPSSPTNGDSGTGGNGDANNGSVDGSTNPGSDSGAADVLVEAAPPECDLTKPFAPAAEVPTVNSPLNNEQHASLTADELSIYFASDRTDGSHYHLFFATRGDRNASFSPPAPVQGLDTESDADDNNPTISGDGTFIAFDSYRAAPPPAMGVIHLWTSTRSSAGVNFPGTASVLARDFVGAPNITTTGVLYAKDLQSGSILRFPKGTSGGFGTAETLSGVATPGSGESPASSDDLTLYVQWGATASVPGTHIWAHTRATTSATYLAAKELTTISVANVNDAPSWVSPNGCRLYLTRRVGVKNHLYIAVRPL